VTGLGGTQRKILQALRSGSQTTADLAKITGASILAVRSSARRLRLAGWVVRPHDRSPTLAITAEGREALADAKTPPSVIKLGPMQRSVLELLIEWDGWGTAGSIAQQEGISYIRALHIVRRLRVHGLVQTQHQNGVKGVDVRLTKRGRSEHAKRLARGQLPGVPARLAGGAS